MKVCVVTLIGRQPVPDYMLSLQRFQREAREFPVELDYLPVVGQANPPRARNLGVQGALDNGADEIVFIDDDIGFDFEAVQALFSVDEDIEVVAGMPQRRSDDPEDVSFCGTFDKDPEIRGHLASGYAATAFMRIKRSVFDRIPADPFQYRGLRSEKNPEGWTKTWFEYRVGPTPSGDEIALNGEDFDFSRKCKEAGIQVWLDPSIRLRHWHMQPLEACAYEQLGLGA